MITAVYGCFGCGGEEEPEYTCTIDYRDEEGQYRLHWLCRPCVREFRKLEKLRELTAEDRHPEAQEHFDGCSPYRMVESLTQGRG